MITRSLLGVGDTDITDSDTVEGPKGSARHGACYDLKCQSLHSPQFSSIALLQTSSNPSADAVGEYGLSMSDDCSCDASMQ